jgi:hypothetical protein
VFKTVIDNKRYVYVDQAFEKWRKHIMSFGLGTRLGVELPNVSKGLVPTVGMYNKVYGEHHWKASTVISLAIGQGEFRNNAPTNGQCNRHFSQSRLVHYTARGQIFGDDKTPLKEFSERHKSNR